jgi:putative glycosyltransferase (TIGR04348 family)
VIIVIVTPSLAHANLGNSITASRWEAILGGLGNEVIVASEWTNESCDLLVALHARHSHSSIERFRKAFPGRAGRAGKPLIVALTGTDLYRDLRDDGTAQKSLAMADRVVALQNVAAEDLDEETRAKLCVIYQSATPPERRPEPLEDCFEVCVLSHLRDVKDPLRAALAARLLPAESRIKVVHAGRALEPVWEQRAREEEQVNPRYQWLGEQNHDRVLELLARSRLLVLSSEMEGGANAIAEAVVCGVPVLCSRIPGNVGMLGLDYPGYFECGDTAKLANLMYRAETDGDFLGELQKAEVRLKDRFSPERERESWRNLLQQL